MIDLELWHLVQQRIYLDRLPSYNKPFPMSACRAGRKPASWWYHRLVTDPAMRAKVFP
jgi:hypothetical protein